MENTFLIISLTAPLNLTIFFSVFAPIFHLHYQKAPTTSSHPRMHSTAGFLFCFSLKLWEPFSAPAKKRSTKQHTQKKITLFSSAPCLFVDRTGKEALGSLCCLTWQCVLFLWQASKCCVWVKNCSLRLHIMDHFSFSRNVQLIRAPDLRYAWQK